MNITEFTPFGHKNFSQKTGFTTLRVYWTLISYKKSERSNVLVLRNRRYRWTDRQTTGVQKFLARCPAFRAHNFTCAPDRAQKNGWSKPKCTSDRDRNIAFCSSSIFQYLHLNFKNFIVSICRDTSWTRHGHKQTTKSNLLPE